MYRVTMHMTERGAVHRQVIVSVRDGENRSVPQEEANRLRGLYGVPISSNGTDVTFAGAFSGTLPPDLTFGAYTSLGVVARTWSPMGQTLSYAERMPGLSDMRALVDHCEQLYDLYVRVLLAALEEEPELRGDPERMAALRSFVEGELRHDVLNVLELAAVAINVQQYVTGHFDSPGDSQHDLLMIPTLYLVEKGYLRAEDLPAIEANGYELVLHGIVRKAATAMGYPTDAAPPAFLTRLFTDDGHRDAVQRGCTAIGSSEEALESRLAATGFRLFGDSAEFKLTWHEPRRPWRTNGEWDESAGEVRWLREDGDWLELAPVLFADWADTNDEYQQQHFGDTVLHDSHLVDYNVWRSSLPPDRVAAWDAFVDSLAPGPELRGRIKAFRFAGSEDAEQPPRGAGLLAREMDRAAEPR
jgi:hypothetical protein